jgi:hypothetical protein
MPQPRPIAPVWPREITKSTQSAAVHTSELRHRRTSKLSRRTAARPSLDPTFQGMTKNAAGGPPSACGIPLIRTDRGRYILAE